jgi:hypothetical protein
MIRMLPIVPAGYGIGAYNKTAPITIRTIAKISKFRCEIAVIYYNIKQTKFITILFFVDIVEIQL